MMAGQYTTLLNVLVPIFGSNDEFQIVFHLSFLLSTQYKCYEYLTVTSLYRVVSTRNNASLPTATSASECH